MTEAQLACLSPHQRGKAGRLRVAGAVQVGQVATDDVRSKEDAANLTRSEPQIAEGDRIGAVLDQVLSRSALSDG
jgi:hypothetical protein